MAVPAALRFPFLPVSRPAVQRDDVVMDGEGVGVGRQRVFIGGDLPVSQLVNPVGDKHHVREPHACQGLDHGPDFLFPGHGGFFNRLAVGVPDVHDGSGGQGPESFLDVPERDRPDFQVVHLLTEPLGHLGNLGDVLLPEAVPGVEEGAPGFPGFRGEFPEIIGPGDGFQRGRGVPDLTPRSHVEKVSGHPGLPRGVTVGAADPVEVKGHVGEFLRVLFRRVFRFFRQAGPAGPIPARDVAGLARHHVHAVQVVPDTAQGMPALGDLVFHAAVAGVFHQVVAVGASESRLVMGVEFGFVNPPHLLGVRSLVALEAVFNFHGF